jgi:hypothetical protein
VAEPAPPALVAELESLLAASRAQQAELRTALLAAVALLDAVQGSTGGS